jgi:hypothetical protein
MGVTFSSESRNLTDDSFNKKMTITRRGFIQNLGIGAIAAASLTSAGSIFAQISKTDGLFAAPPESFSDPLNYLTKAHFEPFVDTFVQVRTGEKQIRLRLIEVTDLKREANESRAFSGESFSLLFEDSRKARLPQDVYPIQHFALGEFSLLLVPTGIKGNRYEAIINRIASR